MLQPVSEKHDEDLYVSYIFTMYLDLTYNIDLCYYYQILHLLNAVHSFESLQSFIKSLKKYVGIQTTRLSQSILSERVERVRKKSYRNGSIDSRNNTRTGNKKGNKEKYKM